MHASDFTTDLAATATGIAALRELTNLTLDALAAGRTERSGPLPVGGPCVVADTVRTVLPQVLPENGRGARVALTEVVRLLAAGAADPADPLCTAHLHGPPLALAAAADLAASVVNPSLDSWDQAPAASEIERHVVGAVATLAYPSRPAADALVTTGATESNLVALLLAREAHRSDGPSRVVCSEDAHHSVTRAAWLLGLPAPSIVPTDNGRCDLDALAAVLAETGGPQIVVATAGTTGRGVIDPLPEMARLARAAGAWFHVDAAYGGGLLFSDTRRPQLAGLGEADTVALDLHKFGWQPLAAGLLAVADRATLAPLDLVADYLNAGDDGEAGLPDLLGRSIRTSRRPDAVKMAVTFRALGRSGLGELVDACCDAATTAADRIVRRPGLQLLAPPQVSTVLFRPAAADGPEGDRLVATIRRALLTSGQAVVGRAVAREPGTPPRLWLKLTVLNPTLTPDAVDQLLDLVEASAAVPIPEGAGRV